MVIALLLVGACATQNASEIVSQSATRAREKGGARLVMSFVISGTAAGRTFRSTSTGSGAFDFEHQRGTLVMKVGGIPGGAPGPALETVTDRSAVYVKCPGGQWVKFDAAKMSGVDPNSFGSDPTTTLDFVKSVSGDVENIGRERVRGTDSTHYRFRASVDELLEHVRPEARERQQRMFRQLGVTSVPFDVWIDDAGLPTRMVMKLDSLRGVSGATFEMTMEMFDYGKPVEVSVPEAAQTIEVSQNASPQSATAFAQCFAGAGS